MQQSLRVGTILLLGIVMVSAPAGCYGVDESFLAALPYHLIYSSSASDLVSNDTNGAIYDVFLHSVLTGQTELVSLNEAGTGSGNGASFGGQASGDGRYVVFSSAATNLQTVIPDGNAEADVFRRGRLTGRTELVSVNATGTGAANGVSYNYHLSRNGRYVSFTGDGTNYQSAVADGNVTRDVFVRDMQAGTTLLASVNSTGTQSGNGLSSDGMLTSDGRYVVFWSYATNLQTAVADGNVLEDVYLRDLVTGTTTLISVNSAGTAPGNGGSWIIGQAVSDDARYVVFYSSATNLQSAIPDTNGTGDVYLRDLVAGSTTLISRNLAGTAAGNGYSGPHGISTDGRYVSFTSVATDLTALPDTNATEDVFLLDLQTWTNTLVSANVSGTAAANADSYGGHLSADGRFVGFRSHATNLIPGFVDGNGAGYDAYLWDRLSGTTRLGSGNLAGTASGNGVSYADFVIGP